MAIDLAKVNLILQGLVINTVGVQGAALVTPDGLPLASMLPADMDEERVAAMSAAMLSLGERISVELNRGNAHRILVEGDQGYGVLTQCGEDAVLVVLASLHTKQGVLLFEIKQAVAELKQLLPTSPG
ncbi:MAG: roadblock/LC7 domain-containing protein [Cyanobacteria bacterium P01_A01_bin.114]